jgi:hypothetical protein
MFRLRGSQHYCDRSILQLQSVENQLGRFPRCLIGIVRIGWERTIPSTFSGIWFVEMPGFRGMYRMKE